MKIKQQKLIKTFLIEEFGKEQALKLFEKEEKLLNGLIKNTKDKSKNQMKTLFKQSFRALRYTKH